MFPDVDHALQGVLGAIKSNVGVNVAEAGNKVATFPGAPFSLPVYVDHAL